MQEVRTFAERNNIPVGLTLLGLGGFPASHPLTFGDDGMHGEAWLNTTIQEADLLIALGMRFDDRVTGNLKTYAPMRKKSILKSIARGQQERESGRGAGWRFARGSA